MSEFQTRLHSVPSGGFLTDRDKDKKPILDVREALKYTPSTSFSNASFVSFSYSPTSGSGMSNSDFWSSLTMSNNESCPVMEYFRSRFT